MRAPRKYAQETRDHAVWLYAERKRSEPRGPLSASRRQGGGLLEVTPRSQLNPLSWTRNWESD